TSLPEGFTALAHTDAAPIAAMGNAERGIYGVQWLPESRASAGGDTIFANFVGTITGLEGGWNASHIAHTQVQHIRDQVGDGQVLCALSGGVDSAVAAALVHEAVGDKLTCVFVDHGLLR